MSEQQLRKLSVAVGEKLKANGQWITCAESCTGGYRQGHHRYCRQLRLFRSWFVTYSNTAKHELLGVAEATLNAHGAVSEEVVREMALGALHAARANLALSVSGIAGPDGGSVEKPVGTVWFGFAESSGRVLAQKMQFSGDRDAVRLQATIFALQTALDEFL